MNPTETEMKILLLLRAVAVLWRKERAGDPDGVVWLSRQEAIEKLNEWIRSFVYGADADEVVQPSPGVSRETPCAFRGCNEFATHAERIRATDTLIAVCDRMDHDYLIAELCPDDHGHQAIRMRPVKP